MATEAAFLGFTTAKWVDAIADLMQLTQKHQLLWRKDEVPRHPYPGPCYITEFSGNILVLQSKPFEKADVGNSWIRALSGVIGSAYVLRAFKADGDLLMTFPSVSALTGLKIAIDAQVNSEADSFLQAIHQATKQAANRYSDNRSAAFSQQSAEVMETTEVPNGEVSRAVEEVVVGKTTRVVEEVIPGKTATGRTETLYDKGHWNNK